MRAVQTEFIQQKWLIKCRLLQVAYKAKKGCQAHPGLAAVVEEPQQGPVSWITAEKTRCSCLLRFFLIELRYRSALRSPSLLVSCDNHLLFCLGSKAVLAFSAFPSVYLDSSSAFRAHKSSSSVLFARFWYTTLLLKAWVSWCLTACLFLSHFLALCSMWYVSELFIFIFNPRYTHTYYLNAYCMSVIGGSIVDKTILFPMSTNLKIQQLRQILILKPDKHIIPTCDQYHEWKQNALT